jgi:hypothetical protein
MAFIVSRHSRPTVTIGGKRIEVTNISIDLGNRISHEPRKTQSRDKFLLDIRVRGEMEDGRKSADYPVGHESRRGDPGQDEDSVPVWRSS